MNHSRLRRLLFLALCCDFGLIGKRMIAPFANVVTDALHIPGGISTGFSLMFVVIASALVSRFGCATLMSAVQSLLAIALGRVGSMGILSPIGYIVPGIAIDLVLWMTRKFSLADRMVFANAIASVCASLSANVIVFHLKGTALALYLCIAAISGALWGWLGARMVPLIRRAVSFSETGKE